LVAQATTTPPSTASQEKGMVRGLPFVDPQDANTIASPHLTITLDAARTHFDVSGRYLWGESYNGSFVAPTLHFAPGETVTITLVNHLAAATNLHFHGLHVSPSDASDDPFICVAPGKTFNYRLAIPANHSVGTFWYHSHAMGTTCPASTAMAGMGDMAGSTFVPGDVENQIFAGLSGALLIGDDRSLLPPALQHITAHTFVLKDVQIDGSGHIVQNTATNSISSSNPTVRLVNGELQPVLNLRPGETQLWRFVNAGADIFYQLQLDGYRFTVIGEDGRPVAQVTKASTLLLPPGKRFDVLVTAGDAPSGTWLRTTAYSNGPQGDVYPDTPLVKVQIAGPEAPHLPTVTGAIPTAAPSLAGAPVAQHRTVVLTENSAGTVFFINGKQFSMAHSVFDTPAKVNTVEEWTVINKTGEIHPLHIHTNAFQVMSINGVPQPYTHVQDIIPVPNQQNGVAGQVVLRIAFSDYTGHWMFHCHIAAHEDNGMMSFVNVVS
jgi:FtsP/CotA-like multicopper oxidase with cupredoxin domain